MTTEQSIATPDTTFRAESLRHDAQGVSLRARIEDGWIVFFGGKSEHAIALNTSDRERILAHWSGYIWNNAPQVVTFRCKSSPTLQRTGRVLRQTDTRVHVEFSFKNGRATTRWVRKSGIIHWHARGEFVSGRFGVRPAAGARREGIR